MPTINVDDDFFEDDDDLFEDDDDLFDDDEDFEDDRYEEEALQDLATEDETYPQGFADAPEEPEEYDYSVWEEDLQDLINDTEDDGPWYDPQDGRY